MVVLDEVHYLQDPYRGSVWEEVLVLTPPGVAFVSLSATVNNAEDFGRWLTSVRGTTRVVVETHRPVTLHHHYAVAERGRDGVSVLPLLRNGAANPDGLKLDDRRRRSSHQRFRAPRRTEVVEYLHDAGMLPAITFIFSRAACDDATRQVVTEGVRLTTDQERTRIRALIESSVERLSDDDLRTLGYGAWSDALEAGVAPHHAGLVPAFRQAVERCFSEGLLKVVFATETLALGINMPARTVVVERFAKFRGSDTSALTSGEYQQLTGRAGRRGIDTVGHAFVLWNQATSFGLVARTAVAPPPDLVSSFHPTYNLAVNLVRRWSREEAHGLLESSYGQWQAPPGSESLVAQLDRRLAILGDRRFLDGWELTGDGLRLAGIYHESDLLVAEILRGGLLDDLEPAQLAGVASALTFEARRVGDDPPVPRQPGWSSVWPPWRPWRPACGPTSAGWACAAPVGPTGDWPGLWWPGRPAGPSTRCCVTPRWPRGTSSATCARSSTWSARSDRWPSQPPPGTTPIWPWRCSEGASWGPTIRPPWGPRLTTRPRPSVRQACSPTPWKPSVPRKPTSCGAMSPISTNRSSHW